MRKRQRENVPICWLMSQRPAEVGIPCSSQGLHSNFPRGVRNRVTYAVTTACKGLYVAGGWNQVPGHEPKHSDMRCACPNWRRTHWAKHPLSKSRVFAREN